MYILPFNCKKLGRKEKGCRTNCIFFGIYMSIAITQLINDKETAANPLTSITNFSQTCYIWINNETDYESKLIELSFFLSFKC